MTPLTTQHFRPQENPIDVPAPHRFRIQTESDPSVAPRVYGPLTAPEAEATMTSLTHDMVWAEGQGGVTRIELSIDRTLPAAA